jgi:hypothetical protein
MSPDPIQTTVLYDAPALNRLALDVAVLMRQVGVADDISHDPTYFAFGVVRQDWHPCVVTARRDGRLVGVVYAVESAALGLRTGRARIGDGYGGATVIADHCDRADVLRAAIGALARVGRIHSLDLRLPASDWQADSLAAAIPIPSAHSDPTIDIASGTIVTKRCRVPLAASYDGFLARIGSRTRRNLQYYRRRATRAGVQYRPAMTRAQFADARHALEHQNDFATSARTWAELDRLGDAIYTGLWSPRDRWLGVLVAARRGDRVYVGAQINSNRYPKASLSTVLRAYFFEQCCQTGVADVVFLGGTSEVLARACEPHDVLVTNLALPATWHRRARAAWHRLGGSIRFWADWPRRYERHLRRHHDLPGAARAAVTSVDPPPHLSWTSA